jgi:glycosyltransferase involved in cell wall biosynthesis
MKVALIHDWLTGMRGGEKVLEVFCELYPEATLYTLLHRKGSMSPTIEAMDIRPSFLQKVPGIFKHYRHFLPLFPYAVEAFDVVDHDLVISLSHCAALGTITRPNTCHICYCFTPMRYAWDMNREYFGGPKTGIMSRLLIALFLNRLRLWDVAASHRVDHFIGISNYVADRIRKVYRREAEVVYPPVSVDRFGVKQPEDFYLVVSALSPYKRVELAVHTFNRLGLPLVIIGEGPMYKELRAIARGNISFMGWQSDEVVADYFARCRAFVFCGIEDFGITILEASASGRPVIAFRGGGALETVIEHKTGEFFEEQSEEALAAAIENFHPSDYDPASIREHSLRFDRRHFKRRVAESVSRAVDRFSRKESGFVQTT